MRNRSLIWFLFGLGSQLQLFGTSLCFSELFILVAAPVLFSSEWPYMRRNGVTTFFWLAIGALCNCALSCWYNHTSPFGIIRGMSIVCLWPCAIVVAHWMLRKDMVNFKWWIVGSAFSNLLCTFVFQRSVQVSSLAGGESGAKAVEGIMNGPLWMVSQLGYFCTAVPKGWYLQVPLWLSVAIPTGLAAFALFTTASGRSSSLGSLGSALLVIFGGKKSSQIRRRVCNRFWTLCVVGLLAVFGFKTFYKTAATSGWLGDEAQKKYEEQTKGGEDAMSLLLGGRMESFAGLLACVDQPLIGFGPWALDVKGYTAEFLAKYGTEEDYKTMEEMFRHSSGLMLLPCHSHITMSWLHYGIFGLIFWMYVLYVIVRHLRQDCYAVPQWYMWIAASAPGFVWNIFFSPLGARIEPMMFVVAMLMVRAVRKGIQPLPYEMVEEIRRVESK